MKVLGQRLKHWLHSKPHYNEDCMRFKLNNADLYAVWNKNGAGVKYW